MKMSLQCLPKDDRKMVRTHINLLRCDFQNLFVKNLVPHGKVLIALHNVFADIDDNIYAEVYACDPGKLRKPFFFVYMSYEGTLWRVDTDKQFSQLIQALRMCVREDMIRRGQSPLSIEMVSTPVPILRSTFETSHAA